MKEKVNLIQILSFFLDDSKIFTNIYFIHYLPNLSYKDL